ncbi:hypothetical protein B0H10DRAFT_1379673, partial [Mycena sp. CBHHK59/15]
MPHPSNPLDDFHAHSFNREHGPARAGSRGRLVFLSLVLARALRRGSQRVERLSDGFLSTMFFSSVPFCKRSAYAPVSFFAMFLYQVQ